MVPAPSSTNQVLIKKLSSTLPHVGGSSGPTPNIVFESLSPLVALLLEAKFSENVTLYFSVAMVSVKAVHMGANGNIFYTSIFKLNQLILKKIELHLQ